MGSIINTKQVAYNEHIMNRMILLKIQKLLKDNEPQTNDMDDKPSHHDGTVNVFKLKRKIRKE